MERLWSQRRSPSPWPRGRRIITIKGSALNLSPLARLLLSNQRVPLIDTPDFITGKEMLTWATNGFDIAVEIVVLKVKK